MNELWSTFVDRDGNFLEQWQTTAFDARTWEFFLFAYLTSSGYSIPQLHSSPDFLAQRDGVTAAIEAVTTNPSPNFPGVPRATHSDPYDTGEQEEDIREKQANELPIRFGSPLFSKLKKRYWEQPHCHGIPLVFAIEAFHEPSALWFSDASLAQYLFGLRHFPIWSAEGQLLIQSELVSNHIQGEKVIPSNFFNQPEAEHVSAVLFGNVGTVAKFDRMGFQRGYGSDAIVGMYRTGLCYDPNTNADQPAPFQYDVSRRDPPESWGEGLVVIHNPHALRPLSRDFFVNAAQTYMEDGEVYTDVPLPFHPYASRTITLVAAETE
jgi:hypothetical protein